MTDSKCAHCPLADSLCPCLAVVARHHRICEFLDPGARVYDPRYAKVVRDWVPPEAESATLPVPANVKAELALLARMKACPYWQASSACGCGVNRCRLGKGKGGLVTHADCRECLEAQDEAEDKGKPKDEPKDEAKDKPDDKVKDEAKDEPKDEAKDKPDDKVKDEAKDKGKK